MASSKRNPVNISSSAAYFDHFAPLRQMMSLKEQTDRILGPNKLARINEITKSQAADIVKATRPAIDLRGADLSKSVLASLDLKPLTSGAIAANALATLDSTSTLSEALKKADLYGPLRHAMKRNGAGA